MRFYLKQASIALILLVAPSTALHALDIAPDSGDCSKLEVFVFGICNLTQGVSESAQIFGNGDGIDGSGSPWACVTVNGFDDTSTIDVNLEEPETSEPAPEAPAFFEDLAEPFSTGWAIVLDNDALVSGSRDEDYTGGFAVALGGSRVTKYRFSLDPALAWINKKLHLDGGRQRATLNHLMQFGLVLFTPDLDEAGGPKFDERPFANLLFLENSQFRTDASKNRAYQTTLSVGILGSGVGEIVQNAIHHAVGITNASDYGYQISDGVELTARYAVSMQSLLKSSFTGRGNTLELKYRVEGDIGYITEGSATLAARWGHVESPWWSFAPTRSNYLPQPIPASRGNFRETGGRDFFLWSAITIRARAYNAFLQGQVRDSEITYSGGELNHILGELSIGLNRRFGNAVNVSLALHYQTNEIKHHNGSTKVRWGGLTIQKSF